MDNAKRKGREITEANRRSRKRKDLMDREIETVAETIMWIAEKRISERGQSYSNLISAIYSTNMEVAKIVEKKLAELRKALGKKK